MNVNKQAIFAVFNDADKSSASFAEQLLAQGIASRSDARPLAMQWASEKYQARITHGQRGDKLPRDSAAERAMNRVLQVCFPSADLKRKSTSSNKSDPVKRLLKAYAELTGAEKRRFKSAM